MTPYQNVSLHQKKLQLLDDEVIDFMYTFSDYGLLGNQLLKQCARVHTHSHARTHTHTHTHTHRGTTENTNAHIHSTENTHIHTDAQSVSWTNDDHTTMTQC